MKQRLLMMVLALGMLSINGSAQTKKRTPVKRTTTTTTNPATTTTTKERQVGSDGYIWYRLKKGNLYGAQDIEGRQIIPVKYNRVEYKTGTIRYFTVKANDFEGVYTRKGTLVISTDKHYTSVRPGGGLSIDEVVGVVFWEVKKNDGGIIILDARGNEVFSAERYSSVMMYYDTHTEGEPYYFAVSQGDNR